MDTRQVIANPAFKRLWAAQILSLIAQNFLNFALIIRVFELASGSHFANVSVSLVVLAYGVPSIFFAAVAGVYVDHWDRRRVMIVANLIRAVLVLGYLLVEQNFALVLALTFLVSTTTQFFAPAEASTIPKIFARRLLIAANSLFVLTFYACFVIGYSLAAPVLKLVGAPNTYIITALLFAVATLFSARLPHIGIADPTELHLRRILHITTRELRENRQAILRNSNLYFPILQLAVIQALIGIVLALAPALSLAVLHRTLEDASLVLIVPTGIGLVIGVSLVGRLARRASKTRIITTGFVVLGGCITLLGLTGQLYRHHGAVQLATASQIALVVGGLMLLLGLMNAIISVSAQTILQESSPDDERGRIFGALNMMINIAATLPILFAGVLTDVLQSVTRVITAAGIMVLVYALIQLVWLESRQRLARASQNA